MKTIKMLAMAIIIAGMFHANAAKGQDANGIKVEKVWEKQLVDETQQLFGVWFSPSDKYIIVQGSEHNYFVLDQKYGNKILELSNNSSYEDWKYHYTYNNPRFIYNDTILLLENENKTTIDFHTFPDMRIIGSLQSTDGQIVTYDVSKDQKLLVADVDGQKIVLWDLETKKIVREKRIEKFEGEKSSGIATPIFIPNRNQIFVIHSHTYVTGYQPKPPHEQTKTISTSNVLNYNLDSVDAWEYNGSYSKFSSDGKYITKRYYEGEGNSQQIVYYIIEYDTKKIIQTIHTGYFGTVGNYFITPNNKYLILAAETRSEVFSINTGKKVFSFNHGSSGGAYSSNGNEIVFSLAYRLRKYSFSEISSVTNVSNSNYLQYSNPIIKDSIIQLFVGNSGKLKIVLSDERGVIIKELTNQYYEEGNYSIDLKTNDLPNGLYFLTLTDDSGSHTHKIIIER